MHIKGVSLGSSNCFNKETRNTQLLQSLLNLGVRDIDSKFIKEI